MKSAKLIDRKCVREHFDDRSSSYSELFDDSTRSGAAFNFRSRRRIMSNFAAGQTGSLLDCASGTGEITLAALHQGNFTSACVNDYSDQMLSRSKALIAPYADADIEYLNHDVFELGRILDGRKFNFVICAGLLAHTGKLNELLRILRNLLDSDGRLILQSTLLDHPGIRIIRSLTEGRHIRRFGYAIKHYHHSEIMTAAGKADLRIENCVRLGVSVPFLDRLSPRLNHALENRLSPLGKRWGAEALYCLRPA